MIAKHHLNTPNFSTKKEKELKVNKNWNMIDITMCLNEDCPIKKKCYRYMAVPNQRQSVAMFTPINRLVSGVECDYFYTIESYHRTILE
jgi:hypothetical protein